MNKIFLTIILFCFGITLNAQNLSKGSLIRLKDESIVHCIIDYSNASIHGMSEDEFARYEEDWMLDKPEITSKFIANANQKLSGYITLSQTTNANYTVKILVISIDLKGNTICEASIINKEGQEIAHIENIRADGGTFGSKLNLIKDGAEHSGTIFGKTLKSLIKKSK